MQFDEEQLTEEIIEDKTQETLKILDKISALYDSALKQAVKLADTPQSKKRLYLHARYAVSRTRIKCRNWRVHLSLTCTSGIA